MVDFINQLRRGGMEKKDAIIESEKPDSVRSL